MRLNFKQFLNDIKDSAALLISIFLFIMIYSLIGLYLFRYTYEGFKYFSNFERSFCNMVILMTTANFPDIMLPAYTQNYWNMLFFVSYLILGLYFLMSFLLANVFNKFKGRLEEAAANIHCKTENLLIELFDRFDEQKKGHLNYNEAKEFFQTLLNLDLTHSK